MAKGLREEDVMSLLKQEETQFKNAAKPEARQKAITAMVATASGKAECNASNGRNVQRAGLFMVMHLRAANDAATAEMLAKGLHDIMASEDNKYVTKQNIGEAMDGLIEAVNLTSLQPAVREVIADELVAMAANEAVIKKIGNTKTDAIASALLPSFNNQANQVIENVLETGTVEAIQMPETLGTWLRVMSETPSTDEPRIRTVELLGANKIFDVSQDDELQERVNLRYKQYAGVKDDVTGTNARITEGLYNIGFKFEMATA